MRPFEEIAERMVDAMDADETSFYDCQDCPASFESVRTDCPECGGLVVRVVEDGPALRGE